MNIQIFESVSMPVPSVLGALLETEQHVLAVWGMHDTGASVEALGVSWARRKAGNYSLIIRMK